jgi:hypothetical protein
MIHEVFEKKKERAAYQRDWMRKRRAANPAFREAERGGVRERYRADVEESRVRRAVAAIIADNNRR